jgi:hypothetical protein
MRTLRVFTAALMVLSIFQSATYSLEAQREVAPAATKASDNSPAPIPYELRGKWTIRKELPAQTISCWGEKEARALIGTRIEYQTTTLRWEKITVKVLGSVTKTIEAQQWAEDNDGHDKYSHANLRQLGIKKPEVTQITIDYADPYPRDTTRVTSELPGGGDILLKSRNQIVFSVCNVFFEADRVISRR